MIYIEDFYRNFGYPFADQVNGGSIKGILDAVDLIEKIGRLNTTLVPGRHADQEGSLPYRAMLADIISQGDSAAQSGQGAEGRSAANLTAPYDKTTQGDAQQSKGALSPEAYDR